MARNNLGSQSISLGRMALLAMLSCGIGIGLVLGIVGFHEGGVGRGLVGFLIGAPVGALAGLIKSPIAFLYAQSSQQQTRRRAKSKKKFN